MKYRKAAKDCGLSLLFRKGHRPDTAAIRALAAQDCSFSISYDPYRPIGEAQQIVPIGISADTGYSLELLADGLTFDLSGLADGPARNNPDCAYRFDLPEEFDVRSVEAITLHPGPHLAGGEQMAPVVRRMMEIVAEFCALDALAAIAWHPARSWIGPHYFASITRNWLEGGVFPGLGLVGLDLSADGGMQSEGVAFFVGQEVRIEPELAENHGSATRIAMRVIDYLVEKGRLAAVEQMAGPEGRMLRIEPSANRRFVRVWGG